MIDINEEVFNLLKDNLNCKVVFSRPEQIVEFPLVTLQEESNTEYDIFHDEITFDISIWERSYYNANKIAKVICEVMKKAGFKRISKLSLPEKNIEHINIRFNGIVDIKKIIYK